jgi:hypothetical protein
LRNGMAPGGRRRLVRLRGLSPAGAACGIRHQQIHRITQIVSNHRHPISRLIGVHCPAPWLRAARANLRQCSRSSGRRCFSQSASGQSAPAMRTAAASPSFVGVGDAVRSDCQRSVSRSITPSPSFVGVGDASLAKTPGAPHFGQNARPPKSPCSLQTHRLTALLLQCVRGRGWASGFADRATREWSLNLC